MLVRKAMVCFALHGFVHAHAVDFAETTRTLQKEMTALGPGLQVSARGDHAIIVVIDEAGKGKLVTPNLITNARHAADSRLQNWKQTECRHDAAALY